MHALDNCGGGELKEVHCRPEPERHDSWGTLERKADRLPGVNDVGARLSLIVAVHQRACIFL
jgi:hypothetical protein